MLTNHKLTQEEKKKRCKTIKVHQTKKEKKKMQGV